MSTAPPRPTVVIAGASGFVGQALGAALAPRCEVVGLSRQLPSGGPRPPFSSWRACDLFSRAETEEALRGADVVVYLVHSMRPSARLTQGSFRDMDLLCADNLARAARTHRLQRIVYLGGLVSDAAAAPAAGEAPLGSQAPGLSAHLRSRLEVEEVLGASGVPLCALRAGLVIGSGGSSYLMLLRLVQRLPIMICPAWTETLTQPIALRDVVSLLQAAVLGEAPPGSHDIGGPDVMTYREMMARTAAVLGRRVRMLPVPLLSPGLSTLWLSLVTGAPRDLAGPLVASLRHRTVARDRALQERLGLPGQPFEAALREALESSGGEAKPLAYRRAPPPPERSVRSVQRLPLPPGRDADWVAREYLDWLPRLLRAGFRVEPTADDRARFFLWPLRQPLLELTLSRQRSAPDRRLFYITGGLLFEGVPGRARLEFRQVPDQPFVLAAIHEYVPRLPWLLYSLTQAVVHLLVMALFGRHLARATT